MDLKCNQRIRRFSQRNARLYNALKTTAFTVKYAGVKAMNST